MKGYFLFNEKDQWGLISRLFHWIGATLAVYMLAIGIYMDEYAVPPLKIEPYGYHKSIGFLFLFIIMLRLLWRFSQPIPSLTKMVNPINFLMKSSPYVLYFLLLAMPISGIIMS